MDKPLAAEMQAIASAPGGDGFLDDQQLSRLFNQYLAAFEAAGITLEQLDCAKAKPYSLCVLGCAQRCLHLSVSETIIAPKLS